MVNREKKVLDRTTILHRAYMSQNYKLESPENIEIMTNTGEYAWTECINKISKELLKGYDVTKYDLRKKLKDVFLFVDDYKLNIILIRFYNDYTGVEIRYIDHTVNADVGYELVRVISSVRDISPVIFSLFRRELNVILDLTSTKPTCYEYRKINGVLNTLFTK